MWVGALARAAQVLSSCRKPAILYGAGALFAADLVAVGLAGGPASVVVAAVGIAVVLVTAQAVSESADRRLVLALTLAAILVRQLLAAVLDFVLQATGRAGALFLDDAGYVQLADDLARYWRGEDVAVSADYSVMNTYIDLAAALFLIVGRNVLALKLVNTSFAVLAGLLVYRTMTNLQLPGARWALVLMSVFPSLVLWSALALKDAYALLFLYMSIWGTSEFVRTGRYAWFLPTLISLLALENVRRYLFVILGVLWPVALILSVRHGRVRSAFAAAACVAGLFLLLQPFSYFRPTPLQEVRRAMAGKARSAFVETPPQALALPSGARFIVRVPDESPAPGVAPTVHTVAPGTLIVVQTKDGPCVGSSDGPPGSVIFRPGDVVVVAASQATPMPGPPSEIVLACGAVRQVTVATPSPQGDDVNLVMGVVENVLHLPVGILYLVGAPFPLAARTLSELATVPEMLLWYASLALAVLGAGWILHERAFQHAYGLLVMAAIALVLSLVEGNVGTLLRHRAMLIPSVAVLAAIGAERLLRGRQGGRT